MPLKKGGSCIWGRRYICVIKKQLHKCTFNVMMPTSKDLPVRKTLCLCQLPLGHHNLCALSYSFSLCLCFIETAFWVSEHRLVSQNKPRDLFLLLLGQKCLLRKRKYWYCWTDLQRLTVCISVLLFGIYFSHLFHSFVFLAYWQFCL